MNRLVMAIVVSAVAGVANAGNLCSMNPFTKGEAEQGKVAFDSHCAFCHQYSMVGREPGNDKNEKPDISLLSESDLHMVTSNGGAVPPLVGEKFFRKWEGKTFTEFSSTVSSAAIGFPTKDFKTPGSYFLIAAYVLSRNCGKM